MPRIMTKIMLIALMLEACASTSSNAGASAVDPDFVVKPSADTALGRAAMQLETLSRGTIVYSPKFLQEHPYAAGSFSREKNIIFIEKDTLDNPDKLSTILRHELLHARVFAELTTRTIAPWYGYFNGEPFAPNTLWLDEALAYQQDLIAAAQELTGAKDPVTLVNGVAKKLLHGGWHSEPAAEALSALPANNELCATAKYEEEFGVVIASLETKVEGKPAVAHLFLPASGGIADSRNCALLQKSRLETQKFATDAANMFRDRKSELERILLLPKDDVAPTLLRFASELASAHMPSAGSSLRIPIPSYSSAAGKIVLRSTAEPIAELSPDVFELLASMRATVVAENGVGLAAPQIGVSKRVILVKRSKTILVQAMNDRGEKIEEQFGGYVARIFQHEIDHLDGILFIDRKEPGDLVPKDEVRRLRQMAALGYPSF